MNIAGFSISNWVTYGFSFVGNGNAVAWRVPLALQFIFIAILWIASGSRGKKPPSPHSNFIHSKARQGRKTVIERAMLLGKVHVIVKKDAMSR